MELRSTLWQKALSWCDGMALGRLTCCSCRMRDDSLLVRRQVGSVCRGKLGDFLEQLYARSQDGTENGIDIQEEGTYADIPDDDPNWEYDPETDEWWHPSWDEYEVKQESGYFWLDRSFDFEVLLRVKHRINEVLSVLAAVAERGDVDAVRAVMPLLRVKELYWQPLPNYDDFEEVFCPFTDKIAKLLTKVGALLSKDRTAMSMAIWEEGVETEDHGLSYLTPFDVVPLVELKPGNETIHWRLRMESIREAYVFIKKQGQLDAYVDALLVTEWGKDERAFNVMLLEGDIEALLNGFSRCRSPGRRKAFMEAVIKSGDATVATQCFTNPDAKYTLLSVAEERIEMHGHTPCLEEVLRLASAEIDKFKGSVDFKAKNAREVQALAGALQGMGFGKGHIGGVPFDQLDPVLWGTCLRVMQVSSEHQRQMQIQLLSEELGLSGGLPMDCDEAGVKAVEAYSVKLAFDHITQTIARLHRKLGFNGGKGSHSTVYDGSGSDRRGHGKGDGSCGSKDYNADSDGSYYGKGKGKGWGKDKWSDGNSLGLLFCCLHRHFPEGFDDAFSIGEEMMS